MKKGFLVIIEGSDGSGKATQTELLSNRLLGLNLPVKKITFPNYESPSSALIKMYLGGDFGSRAEDVSPYVASTFYAADRFASYKMDWGADFDNGKVIVSDRYTTSNMVHQGAKIQDIEARVEFLDWLKDYEYRIMGLPEPDMVLFLDVPPEVSKKWRQDRANKIDGTEIQDIHERDEQHLKQAYGTAVGIAQRYHWESISALKGDGILTIEEIHEAIWVRVTKALKEKGWIQE